MLIRITPDGLRGELTPADFERYERDRIRAAELATLAADAIRRAREYLARLEQPRPRLSVLLNPNTAKNSKTAENAGEPQAHTLGARVRKAGPFSISENITLQK